MRSSSKFERGTSFGGSNRTDGEVKVGLQNANADGPRRGRVTPCGFYNYHALAGCGSDTFRALNEGRGWRAALLGTVATGALWMMAPRPAKAGPTGCTTVGDTATCTGDQSAGITSATDFDPGTVKTLNVNSLTTNITPAAGTAGIFFHRTSGDVTINADISPFTITTTGSGAGINAYTGTGTISVTSNAAIDAAGNGIRTVAGGNITVDSTGDITAGFGGISAAGGGYVHVTNNGTINAYNSAGIGATALIGAADARVESIGDITATGGAGILATGIDGDVTVKSTGDITSTTNDGIFAHSSTGAVYVNSAGSISAAGATGDGLRASSAGYVKVVSSGDITSSNGYGISAVSSGDAVYVKSAGAISAADDGFLASGTGDVTVNSAGDISSATGYGINAHSGGAVSVINNGTISANSDGIYAKAANNVTVTSVGDITSTNGRGIYTLSNSGTVSVTSGGNISANQDGIFAKAAGDVTVTSTGDISSSAGRGIYAYSAHASSANGDVKVTSGGNINAAGDGIYVNMHFAGGNITVHSAGDITTSGGSGIYANSFNGGAIVVTNAGNISAPSGYGIFVRSVRGLGGSAPAFASVTSSGNITASGNAIDARSATATVVISTGDLTSTAGNGISASGNTTSVTSNGTIRANATGIYASAPGNVTVTSTGDITSYTGPGIRAEASGASGGTVTVTSDGNISAYADGIVAKSTNVSGNGGAVTVNQIGDITSAHGRGIYADSYGTSGSSNVSITSSGNISASSDGIFARTAANVTVDSTGDITSAAGNGIYAQSTGGNINVTVNGGTIYGFTAGIEVVNGTTNTITIGSGATVTGGTDAILGGTGDETVNNSGMVTGNVDLGAGANAFNNEAAGLFNSGATMNLGAGNVLVNSGTLAPGGAGTIATTTLTGSFVQNAGGRFAVDLDLNGHTTDRLNVSGTANLSGTVVPKLVSVFGPVPQAFTILSAAGGTTNNGLTAQDTAVVDYKLLFPNATDVELEIASVNFAPSGLTPNEQAVGQHLQQAFLAGGGDLSNLLTELAELDFATFAGDLDHLTPEPYLGQSQAALWSGFDFANSLFSCPLPSSQASLMGEGSCYWLRPSGHVATLGGHDGYMSFNESAAGLTGGVQGELAPNWYLDVGAGYERSTIDTDASSANGNVFHGGAALKYIRNNWLVAGSVSGSFARYDTSRYDIPTAGTATANADTDTLDLRLRLAYAFGTPAFYVKPMVDFDTVGLWRGAIDESGAGALDLHVQNENDWLASAAPAVEIGTQWRQGGYTWRPYVRAGVRFLSEDDFSATASFEGSPAGIAPFTVTSPLDQTLAEISAGFNVWQAKRLSVEVSYDGRFGAHDSENGGAVKLRAAF